MQATVRESAVASALAAVSRSSDMRGNDKVLRVRETNGSWLAFLGREEGKRAAYCLKIKKPDEAVQRPPRVQELPLTQEYEFSVRVHDYFRRSPRFRDSVPRPVQLVIEENAFLMEYAGGVPLKNSLARRGNLIAEHWSSAGLLRTLKTCGSWLRLLHAMDRPNWMPDASLDAASLERRSLRAMARLPEVVRRHVPIDRILDAVSKLEHEDRLLVVSHGDFQPGNISIRDAGVTILDFANGGIHVPEDDLGFCIALLHMQKFRLLFGKLAGTVSSLDNLSEALLSGYGRRTPDDWIRLKAYLPLHILERLVQVSLTIARLPRSVRFFALNRLEAWTSAELPVLLEFPTTSRTVRMTACPSID